MEISLPPAARLVVARLGADFTPPVWLVGGAVRDLLRGEAALDIDLVLDGPPAVVADRLGGAVRAYDRFGTATVELDGSTIDIARARREVYARPGALPAVEPAPLPEDLRRRDFTINAIALGLTGPIAGRLEAFPGAVEDLHAGRLRVLHQASFRDDPTRLLRLARYRGRLGFQVDPATRGLVDEAVAIGALRTVSGSRIGAELRLLARERDPLAAFLALRELGLAVALEPGFGLRDAAEARRALELLPADGRRDLLVIAASARGVAAERLSPWLDELAFPAGERAVVVAAAAGAEALARALSAAAGVPSAIAQAAGAAPVEAVALAGALGAERPAREWLDGLRHVRLAIDGDDLLAAGVPRGPAVGEGLRAALAAALDGRAPGRDEQLAEALRAAG